MKSLFALIVVWIGFGLAHAQGSLQFNQALLLESSASSCTSCWTVPAGKVWKLTSASGNSSNSVRLWLNNKELGIIANHAAGYAGFDVHLMFPLWLPAGSTLGFSNSGSNRNAAFWGIEFNVLP
jgi:hypothetical protein